MIEQTFAIIKPDAVKRQLIGSILTKIEQKGFRIVAMKMLQLTKAQAEGFYAEHKGKEFFEPLVEYMCSGPLVALVLEKENAVKDYRNLIGATNPNNAEDGTIRKQFALNQRENSVHASDSVESAKREISYFFVETLP